MTTDRYYIFWKPNIYLYSPWASNPEPSLFSCISDNIEDAIKSAEKETGLVWSRGQMTLSFKNLGR